MSEPDALPEIRYFVYEPEPVTPAGVEPAHLYFGDLTLGAEIAHVEVAMLHDGEGGTTVVIGDDWDTATVIADTPDT